MLAVDFVGKAKWTAWDGIKGKSADEAKAEYVEKLKSVRDLLLLLSTPPLATPPCLPQGHSQS